MKKNVFYFILIALFVFKKLSFCPGFFYYLGKWFDQQAKVDFKNL